MLCGQVLLLKCSDGDEVDVGILYRFIDRKGIVLVVFIPVALAGNNVWRYQFDRVPQLFELPPPVVGRATGFHVNHCLGVAANKLSHLLRADGFIYQCLTVFIKDGDLKDIFGQIYRDGGSIVHGMGSLGCEDLPLYRASRLKGRSPYH